MSKPNYDREALQDLLAILANPVDQGCTSIHYTPWIAFNSEALAKWRSKWAGVVPVR